MVIARRQTLLQLDDQRIAALDERAAATGVSRSEVVREAVDALLGRGEAAAVDAAIVAGYTAVPAPRPDAWAIARAVEQIAAEPW